MYILHFRSFLVKKIYPRASRGGLNVNLGRFLAKFKTVFWPWSPNTSRQKKLQKTKKFPLDEGMECHLRFDLKPTPESLEPKKLIFIVQISIRVLLQHAEMLHTACMQHSDNNIWSQYVPFDPRMTSVLNFWPKLLLIFSQFRGRA